MAKISAKDCVISVDDSGGTARDISADVESYEFKYAVDSIEVTGFGEGSHNYIPGQKIIGVTLNVYWNEDALVGGTTVIMGIIGSATSKTVTITPETGGSALSGEFMCTGVSISGAPGKDIKMGAVNFQVMGAVAPTFS